MTHHCSTLHSAVLLFSHSQEGQHQDTSLQMQLPLSLLCLFKLYFLYCTTSWALSMSWHLGCEGSLASRGKARVITCPRMPGTVPKWEDAVLCPGQCYCGTVKCLRMRTVAFWYACTHRWNQLQYVQSPSNCKLYQYFLEFLRNYVSIVSTQTATCICAAHGHLKNCFCIWRYKATEVSDLQWWVWRV